MMRNVNVVGVYATLSEQQQQQQQCNLVINPPAGAAANDLFIRKLQSCGSAGAGLIRINKC